MKRVLLTGVNGQVGTFVTRLGENFVELDILPCSRQELDLSDLSKIEGYILETAPDVILNASAYTHVDKAEIDRDLAMTINGYAAAEKLGASLIQISTDYVFNGEKEGEYLPSDSTDPVNYYGETKLHGEQLALEHCSRAVIVRTSWVHSEVGKNFETTMRRLMTEHKELRVINDQQGRPTYARDLAHHCLTLASQAPFSRKITHYAGDEIMTWYELAQNILKTIKEPETKIIHPISTSEYPTPAKRPKNSVLRLSL